MVLETVINDIMISSFTASPDELVRCSVGVATAMQMLNPTPFPPVCVLNEYDDYFGNSVNLVFKYQKPLKRGC
nr:unnamed protein product [uncultured bacterium]